MRLMNTNFATQNATSLLYTSENARFPASNLKLPFRSKQWRSTDTTDQRITFDLQTTEDINSVVLLWPIENGIRLSGSAVIKIQANATNVWTSPAVDQTLTISNDYVVASHFFSTDQSYRYWSVTISDSGNPYGYFELGTVWLGKGIDIPSAQNGFKYGLTDTSKVSSNDFGNRYVDVYPQRATLQFSYQNVDYADIQTIENAFRQNGVSTPVMVALDPLAAVFDKDHFLIYGTFNPSFGLSHVVYDVLNNDGMTVEELA
jgi:hypothetical protein